MVITRQITVLELLDIITEGMPHGSRRSALEGMREQIEELQTIAAKARLLALGTLDSTRLMDTLWAQYIVAHTTGLPDQELAPYDNPELLEQWDALSRNTSK